MPDPVYLSIYFGLGLLATLLEWRSPIRKLNFWAGDAVLLDIASWFFLLIVVDRYANFIRDHLVPIRFYPSHFLLSIPLWVRVIAYYIIGDCSVYWMHRINHTRYMWRVHHFHHSITQMYWFSGVRDTVFQQLMSNLPFVLWAPLVADAGHNVFVGLMFLGIMTNHWMHMNFTWRGGQLTRYIELILVTPRTHQIHHSSAPEHYNKNFGVVLGIWDHLFGTFVSPETTEVKEVGAGKLDNPVQAAWLMLGCLGTDPSDLIRSRVHRLIPYL